MKKTKAVPLILSCLILSACAPQKQYWDSAADMTDQDFYRDKSECSSMAQSSSQQQIHYNPSPSGFADGFINGFNIIAAGQSGTREGANKRGNSSRLTQSFHFFMFEPIFSPVNALNQPI